MFGALAPQQGQQFQAGNVAAQQALLDARPGIESALLGNPVPQAPQGVFRGAPTDFSNVPTQLPERQFGLVPQFPTFPVIPGLPGIPGEPGTFPVIPGLPGAS